MEPCQEATKGQGCPPRGSRDLPSIQKCQTLTGRPRETLCSEIEADPEGDNPDPEGPWNLAKRSLRASSTHPKWTETPTGLNRAINSQVGLGRPCGVDRGVEKQNPEGDNPDPEVREV